MTGPDILMFVIGGTLTALAIVMIAVTQKKERGHHTRWAEYIALVDRAHEGTAKSNELLEETNRLLRELIDEVRNDRATR